MRFLAAGCLLSLLAIPAWGQETVQARQAKQADVSKGLIWLGKQQASDGSWGTKNKLALTGMSGLALLASGSTPQRGPYAGKIRRAIEFVLKCQKLKDNKAYWHPSNGYSAIHNHGYALLFLTQAYGEGGALDRRLKQSIKLGVKATIASQWHTGPSDGGFGYFLYRTDIPPAHKNMWRVDEASTTISQIQALRGARNAGFKVERRALERAEKYIANSQHKKTGGFYYSIGSTPPRVSFVEGSNRPTFAITAACTAVLHALGNYKGPTVDKGIAYIEGFTPGTTRKKKIPFRYYAWYYAAQVMHMMGKRGTRWMSAVRGDLAMRQKGDGGWPADGEDTLASQNSRILNTAWGLQILLLDRGMLPLHER